jgi:hypothetical protein
MWEINGFGQIYFEPHFSEAPPFTAFILLFTKMNYANIRKAMHSCISTHNSYDDNYGSPDYSYEQKRNKWWLFPILATVYEPFEVTYR